MKHPAHAVRALTLSQTLLLSLCLGLPAGPAAAAGTAGDGLTSERVVLYMRHGVRSPTTDPPAGPAVAASSWPKWTVAPGWLTEHGARGVRRLGAFDRRWLVKAGLLPSSGCPAPERIWLHADSDQRTIRTGDEWLAAAVPGCKVPNEHVPQDTPDPLFTHADEDGRLDPQAANAAVTAALGSEGLEGLLASRREPLAAFDRVLCGQKTEGCGLGRLPTTLVPAAAGKGPRLTGALPLASKLSQVLVLEYAEGLPMDQVGWGRATPKDIEALGIFHTTPYIFLGRPPYLAALHVKPIAQRILAALTAADAPALSMLIGHDGGAASLGGLLGLHWQVPGYAADDPPPGGALVFERLHDAQGRQFVRVRYRAQTLDQLRTLVPLGTTTPYFVPLPIEGCGTLCPLSQFQQILSGRLTS